MIIGIDASRANREHKSGTEWYSYYVIRWLARIDAENTYILYTDRPLKSDLCDLTAAPGTVGTYCSPVGPDGCQMVRSPHNNFRAKILGWPFTYLWTQGRLSWEMLVHRPDVLFIPAHTLPIIHPRRSVVTIHDIGFVRDRSLYDADQVGPRKGFKKRLLNGLVRTFTFGKYGASRLDYLNWSTEFGLKRSNRVITVSQFTKDEIMHHFKTADGKISVVYNGYPDATFKRVDDPGRIRATLDNYGIETPYILYVGRIEKKKNLASLVEAFALMEGRKEKGMKLVLAGDAGYGYDEVKYLLREYDITGEVRMTGWVEERNMPLLCSGAHAFAFPSRYEGFGIPLLQAMATGVPIAASRSSSIPEVLDDAGVLFDPDDIADISRALEQASFDPELRRRLAESGFLRVKDFSWQKTAQETLKIISYK